MGRGNVGAGNGPGIVSAEIDLEKLDEIRVQLPSLQHTRPDLF